MGFCSSLSINDPTPTPQKNWSPLVLKLQTFYPLQFWNFWNPPSARDKKHENVNLIDIFFNNQMQWLNYSIVRKAQTSSIDSLSKMIMKCIFTVVHQFYLFSKKLTKYQNTVVFKYCWITKFIFVYQIMQNKFFIQIPWPHPLQNYSPPPKSKFSDPRHQIFSKIFNPPSPTSLFTIIVNDDK